LQHSVFRGAQCSACAKRAARYLGLLTALSPLLESFMKLYLAPGACSLSPHIALREAGLDFQPVRVDLASKRTADGRDFNGINPKGYVPALELASR